MATDGIFLKYLDNLSKSLSLAFGTQNADNLMSEFYRNIGVRKKASAILNPEIAESEKRKEDIYDKFKKINLMPGVTNEQRDAAVEYMKKNNVKSMALQGEEGATLKTGGEKLPLFGSSSVSREYPTFEVKGVPINLQEIENYIERVSGKPAGLRALVNNMQSNVRNIPYANYYGENLPIDNMQELAMWSMYNTPDKYPTFVETQPQILTIPKQPNTTISMQSNRVGRGGGNGGNGKNGSPIDATNVDPNSSKLEKMPFDITFNKKTNTFSLKDIYPVEQMFTVAGKDGYPGQIITIRDTKDGYIEEHKQKDNSNNWTTTKRVGFADNTQVRQRLAALEKAYGAPKRNTLTNPNDKYNTELNGSQTTDLLEHQTGTRPNLSNTLTTKSLDQDQANESKLFSAGKLREEIKIAHTQRINEIKTKTTDNLTRQDVIDAWKIVAPGFEIDPSVHEWLKDSEISMDKNVKTWINTYLIPKLKNYK